MQGRIPVIVLSVIAGISFLSLNGCVNPPERNSGVSPRPSETPGGKVEPSPEATVKIEPTMPEPTRAGGGAQIMNPPVVPPAAEAASVKIKYWLNKTENNNCLTIQPSGSALISAKCTADGAVTNTWVTQEAAVANSPFKLSIQVETTPKGSANKVVSATDNLGENGWRWRCVKTQDKVTKVTMHTICYEDGNALAKTFDSSDLFVQLVGPESVEMAGVQCGSGADIDLARCTPK